VKEKLMKDGRHYRNNSKDVSADFLEKGNTIVYGITSHKIPLFMIAAVGNLFKNSVARTK
jgi:hypothetical protein